VTLRAELSSSVEEQGFAIVPGPFAGDELARVLREIDSAVQTAGRSNTYLGSSGSNVRVEGLLGRVPALASIFTHQPLLEVARAIIGGRLRLSAIHFRSVLPGAVAQNLHQDVQEGQDGWPLVGFIFMIDDFSAENGATRFVPGSASLRQLLAQSTDQRTATHACGPAGSMILFDGSVWHGFGANRTPKPRRSIYGALIRSDATPAKDHVSELSSEALARLTVPARKILMGSHSQSASNRSQMDAPSEIACCSPLA